MKNSLNYFCARDSPYRIIINQRFLFVDHFCAKGVLFFYQNRARFKTLAFYIDSVTTNKTREVRCQARNCWILLGHRRLNFTTEIVEQRLEVRLLDDVALPLSR